MDHEKVSQVVEVVVRFVGMVLVFAGLIMGTHAILQFISVMSAANNLPSGFNVQVNGALGDMGFWGLMAHGATIIWGLIIVGFSEEISGSIVRLRVTREMGEQLSAQDEAEPQP